MGDHKHEAIDTLQKRAQELFSLCDQEKKGFITQNDLVQVISELELPLDSKQVEQAFGKLDNDQNGYLTLEEFTEGFGLFLGLDLDDNANPELEEIATSDPGRELFYLCDTDRKGYITKTDLQRVAIDLNLNFDQLDLIFDKLDQDSNGRLTLEEFADGFGNFLRGVETGESNGLIEQHDIEVELIEPEPAKDVFESSHTFDSSSNTKEDAVFREVVESIGEEVFSGALSKDQLRELWESLQNNDSRAIHKFEDFLSKVSTEIKRARNDSEQLENALKSKMNSHDREVQKLYEEMEQQIKSVKDRYEQEQDKREKALKGELMSELERKEMEIQWMLNKQKKLEELISEKEQYQTQIKSQNEMLVQKNMSLEGQLTDSVMSLEDTRSYVHQLQAMTAEEKEERARQAMKMTEGMKIEQESLIKQLDLLRDVNQKLRDDRDSIEAAHKAKRDRGHSLSDEIEEAENKHKKVNRQGSKMSSYFDGPSKETPEWGHQGAFESIEEGRQHDGSRSSGELKRRRSSKRSKKVKKQGAVAGPNFFSATGLSSSDLTMAPSMNHEVEFDGDVELGKIAEDKPSTPIWASKIMAAYEKAEEKKKEEGAKGAATETEEFRQRKAELLAAEERSSEGEGSHPSAYSSEEYSGSDREERPRFPRTAPVGKDDESTHTESASGSSAALEVWKAPTPVRVFKIVFVGDSGVGKSSFIHRFCHDQWKPSFTATIGVDFQIKNMTVGGRSIVIQLWDTAGQERFRSITKQYFRKADGILVFYDVTAESSFINLKSWMASVEEGAEEKATLMIVGNKVDLSEDSNMRAVKTENGEYLAKNYNALYMETSAKTGYNINEAMNKMAEVLQEREDEMMQSVLNLVNVHQTKKKKCCKS
ncbi:ras and EF-hand domain-containing protein homolog isoform X3 [Actinia tenebrosa]|uniref:Ras and EF-hand domain-containing protein homolog isoform X3 n=1 Tax=Actinia tenebrosa TaxID=6105 RepID=A0A6P8INF2_ACTTE|nr:ras and EF-hand domain-containing protein homolog isoform X3 [Actinia tenebrosa]